jgi:hypothetical protein
VGNGNRTRNRRSHSPVLCQLSYSHRNFLIIATKLQRCQTHSGRRISAARLAANPNHSNNCSVSDLSALLFLLNWRSSKR